MSSSSSLLTVDTVFFYPEENARRHQTERFEIVHMDPPVPVIRRGQSFNVAIRFKERDLQPDRDSLNIIFKCGPQPHPLKGTKGIVQVQMNRNGSTLDLDVTKWGGKLVTNSNKTVTLEVSLFQFSTASLYIIYQMPCPSADDARLVPFWAVGSGDYVQQ